MERNSEEPIYYRVRVHENGRKEILNLPRGENPRNYDIELATQKVIRKMGEGATTWVAVKKSTDVSQEERDW